MNINTYPQTVQNSSGKHIQLVQYTPTISHFNSNVFNQDPNQLSNLSIPAKHAALISKPIGYKRISLNHYKTG